MKVRRAQEKDIPRIQELLHLVLELHAGLRPDLFIPGTVKYSPQELEKMLKDKNHIILVSADENDTASGYVMCQLQGREHSENMTDIRTLYIDDLCVEESVRGTGAAKALAEAARAAAEELGCHNITLNVWTGNERARAFYEKMGFAPMKTVMEQIL